jgi:WD40 repeat protein/tetratricopeptide (TPR) repeat protein
MAEIGCISDTDLKAFVLGELPERLAAAVTRHLELCPACDARARRWDDLADGAIQALRGPAATPTLAHDHTAEPGTDPGAAAAPEPLDLPGFTLLGELGRGAGGVVYQARQHQPERVVALKCLRDGPDPGVEHRARFLAEADAIARLHHPHIVQVHAVGEHHGQPYLCLEYLDGGTLAAKVNGEPQPPREAARLLLLLAGAVRHAHEQGVIHRDLKPSNVLLTSGGTPKVGDFGLARFGRPELTATGAIMGTPSYMAPEQARGDNAAVGPAADVWALGAILYELLTGRPPFRGLGALDTLKQVAEDEPVPPARLQPGVPRDLNVICLKCLEKSPARRYGSAGELKEDLERFLDGRPTRARPVSPLERSRRWCRRNPVVAGLLAAVAVVVAAGTGTSWYLAVDAMREKGRADAKAQEARDNAAETRRRLGELCVGNGVRLADEGDLFAALLWFAEPLVQDAGNADAEAMARLRLAAYCRHAPQPKPTQVLFHEGAVRYAEFSPDGRWVVTACSDKTARVWDADTTGEIPGRFGGPVCPPLKHQGPVLHAAFSPDGRLVVTASGDMSIPGEARVWDAATGQPVTPPLKHPFAVVGAEFTPDGRRFMTASEDGVRVWETGTGQPAGPLLKLGGLEYATFSPDGRRVVTASRDRSARVWDAVTGEPVSPPLKHRNQVQHAAFSPDGRRVVTASYDYTARVWDAVTGQPAGPPLRHGDWVVHAVFSPDGRRVVTASRDKTARVWEADTGQPVGPPLQHQHWVLDAAFSPDGRRVVTASQDGTTRLWDAATGQPVSPSLKHSSAVYHAAFSPDGRRVVTASYDQTARVWEAMPPEAGSLTLKHQGEVHHASFSLDGSRVVTASADGTARLWDAATGQPLGPPLKHQSKVYDAAFSPDGRRVVTASEDTTARVWEADGTAEVPGRAGQPAGPPLIHQRPVYHAAFSPDGRRVVTTSGEHPAQVWDAVTGRRTSLSLKHDDRVVDATFSRDGGRVVTGSTDGTARVWEAATGRPVSPPLKQGSGMTVHTAFSPDGSRVVTGSEDGTARVWEAATGQPVTPPLKHQRAVYDAAFSPDGSRVVTAGEDGTARVWDADTGQPVSPPLKHQGAVQHAAFSPDGRRVVTASFDKTARVWDAATGQPLSPPLKHQGVVWDAAFSADGRRVVTASQDGTARVWDLTPDERPKEDLLRLVEVQSGHRLDPTGGFVPLTADEFRAAWQMLKARYPQDFRVSAGTALAWHRRQADESEAAGEWFAARRHLDRLIAAGPDNEVLRSRRARAAIALGDWHQASEDYGKLPRLEADLERACEYAGVLLLQDDQKGYRQVCRRVRQRLGRTEGFDELYLLARILALAPQEDNEPAQALALLEKAGAIHSREAWHRHTLAVAYYRAGRLVPAVELAEKSLQDDPAWDGHIVNWLLLAMARQRQGQEAEARRRLDRAVQWIEQAHKANPAGATGRLPVPPWNDHLEVLLLRREAEQLLKEPPAGK